MNLAVIDKLPYNISGKRVLLRIDIDSSPEQSFESKFSDIKLRSSLPTIEYLIKTGAKTIIATHLRDGADSSFTTAKLDSVATRLAELLGRPVKKLNSVIGYEVGSAISEMKNSDILLLENLFSHPGEQINDPQFAKELSSLADIYCNDAFSLASESLASTIGIVRYLHPAVAGLHMEKEILTLDALLGVAKTPMVAVIAGNRLDEKLPILENLLPRLDRLFVGGALATLFLKAKGFNVGAAPVDEAFLSVVKKFLQKTEGKLEIILPQDFIVVDADQLRSYMTGETTTIPASERVLVSEIRPHQFPVDIGSWSTNQLKEVLEGAHTIIWNGPLGMWEIEPFSKSTKEVATFLVEFIWPDYKGSIICGDSLTRAIQKFNLPIDKMHYLTTGGRSVLEILAGRPLLAISALDSDTDVLRAIHKRHHRILLPVDGSEYSLEAVRQLGLLTEDADITLLYVWNPYLLADETSWIDPETKQRRRVEQQFEAERIFAEVNGELARHGLSSYRQIVLEGEPADQILKYADEASVNLIVMGSHGRTGLLRFIMGSISRKVLDHARCPVLIVRKSSELLEAEIGRAHV